MSLSVCLVTRNEEKKIERVLRSVAGVADEVLVGETGSTDRTAELAAELGAKVLAIAWDDDFAAALNFTLNHANGDWILWVNPDEELLPAGREHLPAYLAAPDVICYAPRVQETIRPGDTASAAETVQPRLFRRQAELRFIGRLHPHFVTPLEELARRAGKQLRGCDLVLRRHAYESVLDEHKLRWAARLLEKELKERPGQLHYLIEYGRTLLWQNDPRGHAVLADAVELVRPVRDAPAAPTPTVGSLLEYLLTVSPQQSRSRILPGEAAELALRWFPNTPPLLWLLAQQAFNREDFRQAGFLLDRLVQLGRTGGYDRLAAFDGRIMSGPAVINLGICHLRLGDLDRAEACFGQLLDDPALSAQAKQNHALVQRLKQQPPAGPPAPGPAAT
jgi:hypothetical protein